MLFVSNKCCKIKLTTFKTNNNLVLIKHARYKNVAYSWMKQVLSAGIGLTSSYIWWGRPWHTLQLVFNIKTNDGQLTMTKSYKIGGLIMKTWHFISLRSFFVKINSSNDVLNITDFWQYLFPFGPRSFCDVIFSSWPTCWPLTYFLAGDDS